MVSDPIPLGIPSRLTFVSVYLDRNSPAYIQQSQQGQTATNWWQKGNGPSQEMSWRCFTILFKL